MNYRISSPAGDFRLYSFTSPFIDEEKETQGAQTDISFKNASNYILSIAQYFYSLTYMKWNKILLDDAYSDNKRSQEIHNADDYVEAKGIIKYNMWFKYL